jgi:hypothetical protein
MDRLPEPPTMAQHVPRVASRPASTVRSARRVGNQRLQNLPLLVGKVHTPPRLEVLNA